MHGRGLSAAPAALNLCGRRASRGELASKFFHRKPELDQQAAAAGPTQGTAASEVRDALRAIRRQPGQTAPGGQVQGGLARELFNHGHAVGSLFQTHLIGEERKRTRQQQRGNDPHADARVV